MNQVYIDWAEARNERVPNKETETEKAHSVKVEDILWRHKLQAVYDSDSSIDL